MWGYKWGMANNAFDGFGFMLPFVALELVLKGFALWKAAKKDQNVWFIALLVINSMGILPLIYLVLNRDQKEAPKKTKNPSKSTMGLTFQ